VQLGLPGGGGGGSGQRVYPCNVHHFPEVLRRAVGGDIELAERRRSRVQRRLAQDERVAVVVYVREAAFVLACRRPDP
jgi:hypothetical protein